MKRSVTRFVELGGLSKGTVSKHILQALWAPVEVRYGKQGHSEREAKSQTVYYGSFNDIYALGLVLVCVGTRDSGGNILRLK